MITDAERATDVAAALLGDVATEEIRALLRDAFAAVRADERRRVLDQLRESVRVRQAQPAVDGDAEVGTWT